MKKLALLVCTLLLPASIVTAQEITYSEIEAGLEYTHILKAEGPQSIHVLKVKLDRPGWKWTTGLGDGRIYGLATTQAIANASASTLQGRLLAAINGDFFAIARGNYQGDPSGLQIMEGEILSAPTNRGCVWFNEEGNPNLGLVESKLRVTWPDGSSETQIGLNERRGDNQAVLYTPRMANNPKDVTKYEYSTRTTDGRELLLEPIDESVWQPFQIGKTYKAKVAFVREGGNSPISKNSVILSIGPKLLSSAPAVKVGEILEVKLETEPDLSGSANAIGGGELLLVNGEIATDGKSKDRHPRSIIGWNTEFLFLIVVDGRAPQVAIGMTYSELAKLAQDLGCTEALNLDGGGSSTLWANGRVLNTPSDQTQRLVANALVLVEVEK